MLVFYIVFTHIILQELIIENRQGTPVFFILQVTAAYTYFVNKDLYECFFNKEKCIIFKSYKMLENQNIPNKFF